MKTSTLAIVALSALSALSGADALRAHRDCSTMISKYDLSNDCLREAYYEDHCKSQRRVRAEGAVAVTGLGISLALLEYKRETRTRKES